MIRTERKQEMESEARKFMNFLAYKYNNYEISVLVNILILFYLRGANDSLEHMNKEIKNQGRKT